MNEWHWKQTINSSRATTFHLQERTNLCEWWIGNFIISCSTITDYVRNETVVSFSSFHCTASPPASKPATSDHRNAKLSPCGIISCTPRRTSGDKCPEIDRMTDRLNRTYKFTTSMAIMFTGKCSRRHRGPDRPRQTRRRKASFCARKRSLVIRPLTHRSMRGPGKTMENQNRKSGLWNTFPFPQIPLIPLLLLCWQRRCWCRSVRTCFSSPRHAATPTPPLSSSLCTYNYKHGAPNTHLISRSWRFTVSS